MSGAQPENNASDHGFSSIDLDDLLAAPTSFSDSYTIGDDEAPIDLTGRNLGGLLIEKKLGEGGMGEVWLGRDEDLDIPVAVKVLPAHLANDQGFVMRFLREARAVAKLNHPGIVRVLQAGRREIDGKFLRIIVMEFVAGIDLQKTLRGEKHGRMESQRAAEIVLACARALHYAHQRGVVHRDIKPANILITRESGAVKLLDFGIAKLASSANAGNTLQQRSQTITGTGDMIGTPAYMSPEQCMGEASDSRADIYSLGVMFYELLSGAIPFDGGSVFEIVAGHIRHPMEFPAELFAGVSPELVQLIAGMCHKDPARRTSLDDVCTRLEGYLGQSAQYATASTRDTAPGATITNLTKRANSFVGRREDLEAIGELLQDGARLVTVAGPGGVGKTRVTQEIGLKYAESGAYDGGVWFCDLSDASDAEAVCQVIARTLGLPLTQADSIAQVETLLSMREATLLILDNFEQVVRQSQATVGRWRQGSPNVTFLVSSREPLRIEGERVVTLRPLGAESRESSVPAGVQLFVDRARAVKRGFELTDENRPAIQGIVEYLEGLPLAIELAASRSSALSPQRILERLPAQFDLLKSKGTHLSSRQATLRGAIDWSWKLLEPWEKLALAQCSVFVGGFSLESAEEVLDLSAFPDAPFEIDVIETLIEKSLLTGSDIRNLPGETRYRMLESIRQYAAEKMADAAALAGFTAPDGAALTGPKALQAMELRHARHFIHFAKRWEEAVHSARSQEALDRMQLDLDNLIAVQQSFQEQHPVLAAHAIQLCAVTLGVRGPWQKRIPCLERAYLGLERANQPALRARIAASLGKAHFDCGERQQLREYALIAHELSASVGGEGDERAVLRLATAQALVFSALRFGEPAKARGVIEEVFREIRIDPFQSHSALSEASRLLRRNVASALINSCGIYRALGDLEKAMACCRESEALFQDLGIRLGVAKNVAERAGLHLLAGQMDMAMASITQAEAIERDIDNRPGLVLCLDIRRGILERMERLEDALAAAREAEALCRGMGKQAGVIQHATRSASILRRLGKFELANNALDRAQCLADVAGTRESQWEILLERALVKLDLTNGEYSRDGKVEYLNAALRMVQDVERARLAGQPPSSIFGFRTNALLAVILLRLHALGCVGIDGAAPAKHAHMAQGMASQAALAADDAAAQHYWQCLKEVAGAGLA